MKDDVPKALQIALNVELWIFLIVLHRFKSTAVASGALITNFYLCFCFTILLVATDPERVQVEIAHALSFFMLLMHEIKDLVQ